MKIKKGLLIGIIILMITNLTCKFVYADEAMSNNLSSNTSSLEYDSTSISKIIYEQVIDDIINGHLSKLADFENKQAYEDYMKEYAKSKIEYRKGEKKGRSDGYKNKIKDISKQSDSFQIGYQKGFTLTNEIYHLKNDQLDSSSSSANKNSVNENSHSINQEPVAQHNISFSKQSSEEIVTEIEETPIKAESILMAELPPLPIGVISLSHQKFIELIADDAVKIARKNDLYPSVMLAQAALESSFGTSDLARPMIYNLFGIKGGYKGNSIQMQTKEDDGFGNLNIISDNFRQYSSYFESLNDYAKVMCQPLFSDVKRSLCDDYHDVTNKLTGTYATDTQYNRKLNQIIETYHLDKYDQIENNTKLKPLSIPNLSLKHRQVKPVKNLKDKIAIKNYKNYVVIGIIVGCISLIVLKKSIARK